MLFAPRKRWLERQWSRAVDDFRELEGIEVWEKPYAELSDVERVHVDAILRQRRNRRIGLQEAWMPAILSFKNLKAGKSSLGGSIFRGVGQSLTVLGLTHDTQLHHLTELARLHATQGDSLRVSFKPESRVAGMTLHFHPDPDARLATQVSVNGRGNLVWIREKEPGQVESFFAKALKGFLRINPAKTLRGNVPQTEQIDQNL